MSLRNMKYDQIVESINSGEIKLFDENPLLKINTNLRNFHRYQVSASLVDPSSLASFGLDIEEKTISVVRDEVNSVLSREVFSQIFNTRKFEYLDFRSSGGLMMGTNTHQDTRTLLNLIMCCKDDYKNIVTTGALGSCLQDLAEFVPTVNNAFASSGAGKTYKIGSIYDLSIWVDPYMKFDDGRMALFGDIDINIIDVSSSIQLQATIHPRLIIEYKLDVNIVNGSKLIFVIDNESSIGFQQYKSLQRDIKIDNVLGEKEG